MPDEPTPPPNPPVPPKPAEQPKPEQAKPEPAKTTTPPPIPKGPVLEPAPSMLHPYYVAHTTFHLPDGKRFERGDVLAGKEALAFEAALRDGATDVNFATPTPHDIDPRG